MILWLDDSREPDAILGKDIVWAKSYDEAVQAVTSCEFSAAYLDHDLVAGEPTGYDVVRWMVDNDCVPRKIVIHSHNVIGAEAMESALRDWAARTHRQLTIRVAPHAQEPWPDPLEDETEWIGG